MSTTITRAPDLVRTPWRNGQGLTTEIAISGTPDDFAWRVSVAEVARSGDFSLFPGIDRTIVLVEGEAMALHLPGRTHVLRPGRPFAFDGGLAVSCSVARPTRDLNLMTRRDTATGSIEVLTAAAGDPATVIHGTAVVVVLEGSFTLDEDELATGDVAVLTEAAGTRLSGAGRVAVVRVDQAG